MATVLCFMFYVLRFTFGDAHLPLALVAVDLVSGREVALRLGQEVDAMQATLALPGLLAPPTPCSQVPQQPLLATARPQTGIRQRADTHPCGRS
jgi:hypothetical protein